MFALEPQQLCVSVCVCWLSIWVRIRVCMRIHSRIRIAICIRIRTRIRICICQGSRGLLAH